MKEIVFTVWDQNVHLQDNIIGLSSAESSLQSKFWFVTTKYHFIIKRTGAARVPLAAVKELHGDDCFEQWLPLVHMNADDFVAGDIRLKIQYTPPGGDGRSDAEGCLILTGTFTFFLARILYWRLLLILSCSLLPVKKARNLAVKDANGLLRFNSDLVSSTMSYKINPNKTVTVILMLRWS